MTRTRNSAFVGTVPQDADVDVAMWKRVFLEIVQTWHYLFDAVTGQNFPGSAPVISTVNHGGTYGRGSNLGIQLMNQAMQEVSLAPNLTDWTTGSFSLDVLLACVPVDVQVGDETFDVGITSDTEFHVDLTVHVKTSAWSTEYSAAMFRDEDRPGYARASVTATTSGLHYILIRATFKDYDARLAFSGINIGVRRVGGSGQVSVKGSAGNVIPITTPGAGIPLAIETIHDEMVADDYAFAGHLVTKLSRQLNGFEEYLTGFPAAGNESLTQADSTTFDPTTSRFKANGQKGYGTTEPGVQFPVFAEALGCIAWTSTGANADAMVNTANPPTIGLTQWHAPYPRDASGATVSASAFNCIMPDFPDGASSTLAFEVIFFGINGKGDPTKWQCRISSTAGASAWTNITNIAGTDFYKCTISAVDFLPDNSGVNTFILQMKKNTAPLTYAFGEILVLGWSATFRP